MSEDLYEKFKGISIWDIANFWIEIYPDDIFITGPYPIVEIRNLFIELLKKQRGNKNGIE